MTSYLNKKRLLSGCLLIMLVLCALPFPAWAQDSLARQYSYACGLYNSGKYFDCVTEMKRTLFFDSGGRYAFDANMMIAQSYKKGGRLQDGEKYFSLAASAARSGEELLSSKTHAARCFMLEGKYNAALNILLNLEENKECGKFNSDINYWKGWAYMLGADYINASACFAKFNPAGSLKRICDSLNQCKYSVSFAKGISYILPGSGQIYAGRYYSGLMSLAWNALWIYVSANSFSAGRMLDGVLTADLLWLRFYGGNIENAGKAASERNDGVHAQLLEYLQNNFEGIKP